MEVRATTNAIVPVSMTTAPTSSTGTGSTAAPASSSATGTSSGSSSSSYDKMDLNQDGIVTPEEVYLYMLNHPGAASSSNIAASYNASGTAAVNANTLPHTVDLSA